MKLMIDPEGGEVKLEAGRKIAIGVGTNRWESQGGTSMLSVAFVILHSEKKDVGALHVERFALTESASWKIGKWAGASGYLQRFDVFNDDEVNNVLASGPVMLTLIEDNYGDKERLKVGSFDRYNHSGEMSDAWETLISQGESMWAAVLNKMQSRSSNSGGSYGNSNHASNPVSSTVTDDIPF
jgi:hypothetical protein